jgi:hypothetical protein
MNMARRFDEVSVKQGVGQHIILTYAPAMEWMLLSG